MFKKMSKLSKSIQSSAFSVMVFRLLLVLTLFTLSRLVFYSFNTHFFGSFFKIDWLQIIMGGIRFDVVIVIYLNVPYILIQLLPGNFKYTSFGKTVSNVIFVFTNSLGLLANCVDAVYFRFNLRRSTWASFEELAKINNKTELFSSFIFRYGYVGVIGLVFLFLLVKIVKNSKVKESKEYSNHIHFDLAFISIFFILAGVRGGDLRHATRPIGINHAGEYVKDANQIALVLNTPFTIFKTLGKKKDPKLAFFKDDIENIYSPVHHPVVSGTNSFKAMNVVVFIIESYTEEASGVVNKNPISGGFTPFLDSLRLQSFYSENSFANGKKSIEAIPALLCSIPSLQEPFVLSQYSTNTLNSLPGLLKKEGYHTSFFHGAANGSMGFQAFSNLIGVDHYFGKNEFGDASQYDGIWGVWDEPFLQFMAKKINAFPQPFQTTVFTLSSHDPFNVPIQYKNRFKKGPHPIYETLSYTDMAVRKFFEKIKNEPWYKNTIFVFSADHTSSSATLPVYKQTLGWFRVPIFFFAPGLNIAKKTENTIQQLDVLPSVLGLLNYGKPFLAFGNNVFDSKSPRFVINHFGNYQWVSGNYVLKFDGEKTTGLYNFAKDLLLAKDLSLKEPIVKQKLEHDVKAFLQQYQNRMIENRLTVQ
jgi:phosphoglycerol transferase MdoB-like AlkP superfamily enzyme